MKIAILKLSALGDIIHCAFVVQFIKQKIHNAQIDWIVEEGFASILKNNPNINNIKTVKLKSLKKNRLSIFKEIKKIREYSKHNYDIVIDFQGLLKSAISAKLLGKNVHGYDKNSTRESIASYLYTKKYDIPYNLNTIDRYRLLCAKSLNISITKEEVLKKEPYIFFQKSDFEISKSYFSNALPNIVFIIGSTWESRIYPKDELLEVAQRLEANILIPYGNEDERLDALYISTLCDRVKILPKMNLNELTALISNADLLIGNDTGPSYIAWANNIPSITLFGPTPATRIYETPINKLLKSSSIIDHYKLDKNDFSINEIRPSQIVKISKELLNG
jgi:heptosyltransferase-1